MFVDGKWYSESELKSYIQKLKNRISELEKLQQNKKSKEKQVVTDD